jgi:hypothetical protein
MDADGTNRASSGSSWTKHSDSQSACWKCKV